jgi:hypothetical protein
MGLIQENDPRSSFEIYNCSFTGCLCERFGGAFQTLFNGKITSCNFDRCRAITNAWVEGGGIHVKTASVNITTCEFSGCTSNTMGGGGISFTGEDLRLEHCWFLFCEAYGSGKYGSDDIKIGGGVRLYRIGGYCNNCTFLNCRTNQHGGAIGQHNSTDLNELSEKGRVLEVNNCIFASNIASVRGGGIELRGIRLKCTNCMFYHNKAGNSGGAIAIDVLDNGNVEGCVFVRNLINSCETGGGGGIFTNFFTIEPTPTFTLDSSIFDGNEVTGCESSKSSDVFVNNSGSTTVKNSNSSSTQDRVCFFFFFFPPFFLLFFYFFFLLIIITNILFF